MKRLILALLLSSVIANPTTGFKNHDSGRIVGGQLANRTQFKYAAAITVRTAQGQHFCGGTLITAKHVLTSAYCVNQALIFDVVLGTNDLTHDDRDVYRVRSTSYVVHPDFSPPSLKHDIGLIKFNLPVAFSDYVQPIDLLATSVLPQEASVVTYGWGQVNNNGPAPVDQLRYVFLDPIPNKQCEKYYGNAVDDNFVCVVGNNHQGTCYGDMGAPLIRYVGFNTPEHVGVASFISRLGCDNEEPSGFIRTYHYSTWIQNITNYN